MVGYDAEDAARRALDRAIEEARTRHARIVVVAVLEVPLNPEGPQNFGSYDDGPPVLMPLEAPPEVERILEEARDRIEPAGVAADYVWLAGEPANSIVGAARDRKASLIVVGTHHHSLFGRIFGEDVAAEVQREAGCDVLVVE